MQTGLRVGASLHTCCQNLREIWGTCFTKLLASLPTPVPSSSTSSNISLMHTSTLQLPCATPWAHPLAPVSPSQCQIRELRPMASSAVPWALQPWEKRQVVPHLEELHATDADWEDFGGLVRLGASYVCAVWVLVLVVPRLYAPLCWGRRMRVKCSRDSVVLRFKSSNAYIEVLYSLLRADCFMPLSRGVALLKSQGLAGTWAGPAIA
jgi:hypothetical protein